MKYRVSDHHLSCIEFLISYQNLCISHEDFRTSNKISFSNLEHRMTCNLEEKEEKIITYEKSNGFDFVRNFH